MIPDNVPPPVLYTRIAVFTCRTSSANFASIADVWTLVTTAVPTPAPSITNPTTTKTSTNVNPLVPEKTRPPLPPTHAHTRSLQRLRPGTIKGPIRMKSKKY